MVKKIEISNSESSGAYDNELFSDILKTEFSYFLDGVVILADGALYTKGSENTILPREGKEPTEVEYKITGKSMTLTAEYMDYIGDEEGNEVEVNVKEIISLVKVDDPAVENVMTIDEIYDELEKIYYEIMDESFRQEYKRLKEMLYWYVKSINTSKLSCLTCSFS